MPEVRTGPVRVSGYAIKLRRVVNAALRQFYKEKKLDAKEINKLISDLNAVIYNILVEKFEVPKDAVVNIILNYEVEDGKFEIKDIKIEVFDLNEILTKNTTLEIKKKLGLVSE
jgi:hypothetical protein